jgi:dTDP-4-dehydrorhamnose 3,5-epimerase
MNVIESRIKGIFQINLDLFDDERGSFRVPWQNEQMAAAGLPTFVPVQSSVSESKKGVIRGIHAEPWCKYIHIAFGTVFVAIVDLREDSETFGEYECFDLDRTRSLYLTAGFGNSFQTTSDFSVYTYLVTDYWRSGVVYPAIAFDDPDLAIPWPISGEAQIVSEKDRHNPTMRQFYPHKY